MPIALPHLSRRSFLQGSVALGAAVITGGVFSFTFPAHAQALYLTGLKDGKNFACRFDIKTQKMKKIELDYLPHSYCPMPDSSTRAIAVEKWGKHASLLDFDEGKILHEFSTTADNLFYGHAIILPKQKLIAIAETDYVSGAGHLALHDLQNLERVGQYVIAPGYIHETRMAPDGTLFIASSGIQPELSGIPQAGHRVEKPSIVHVDPQDGRIMKRIFADDETQSIGHMAISDSGAIIAVCTPALTRTNAPMAVHGNIYTGHVQGDALQKIVFTPQDNNYFVGEMLTAAVSPDGKIGAVTNPASSNLLLIDMERSEVVSKTRLSFASGVVYNKQRKAFMTTSVDNIAEYSVQDWNIAPPHILTVGRVEGIDLTSMAWGHSTLV